MNTINKKDEIIADIKLRLVAAGYDGLLYPGECGCCIDDLAPCEACTKNDPDELWINGCEAGYKHIDTRNSLGFFVITRTKELPTPEEFDKVYANCG